MYSSQEERCYQQLFYLDTTVLEEVQRKRNYTSFPTYLLQILIYDTEI